MKNNFRRVKNRREDFLYYFKQNFEKFFNLTKIDLNGPDNPNILNLDIDQPKGFLCNTCNQGEVICKTSKMGTLYLGCSTFPQCKSVFFFSPKIQQFQEIEEICNMCQNRMVGRDSG